MDRKHYRERLFASTVFSSAALLALSATAASAQDQGATVKEVVVTGSRIPQPNLTSTSPLTVVNDQELKLEGTTNAEDLVNNLPQVFASFGTMESNGASGTATVNLRGLGINRTLVLVDGSRLMPGDTGTGSAADLNQIPAALIDRVEVVTGGASAVYGSDAIAGVVNFIMKKNFEGFRIDTEFKMFQDNNKNSFMQGLEKTAAATNVGGSSAFPVPTGSVTGGDTWQITAVMGANAGDGKGNVTGYASYQHLKAVTQNHYDYSACALASSNAATPASAHQLCAGSSTAFPGRFQFVQQNPADPNFGKSKSYTIDQATGNSFRTGLYNAPQDAFNFAPANYFQRPDERYTAGYFAHYQIKPWAEVYSSFMFMNDVSNAQIAQGGAFRSSGFPLAGNGKPQNPTFAINCDNPLLSAQEGAALCGATFGVPGNFANVNIGRRDVEGSPRVSDIRHTSYRIVEGMKGDLGDAWHYDVSAQYGRVDKQVINGGYFSSIRLARALQVQTDTRATVNGKPNPNFNKIVCTSTIDNTDPNCQPYNIWKIGGVTPAALKYLSVNGVFLGQTTEQVVSGNLTGDLGKYGWKTPWAHDGVGVSLGAEYRRETLATNPDTELQLGDLNGSGGTAHPVKGSFDVKELFGEVRVPLVQDAPWARELSVEAGYRTSDYSSSAGHVNSYKLAGDWRIIDDVRLRASYQRAVRAPNVTELFVDPQFGLFGGQDPCAGAVKAANVAGCAFTGAVVGPNLNNYGHINACSAAQCTAFAGGNPNLKPEQSDTVSYGVVFTPTFIKGFNATIDFWDVKVNNVISAIAPKLSLNRCFATGLAAYCNNIHRGPNTGEVSGEGFVSTINKNLGELHNKGVDIEANYRTRFADWGMGDWGGLSFNFVGSLQSKAATTVIPGTSEKYDCAGLYGLVCGTPSPKWRHKLRATWTTPWSGVALSADWRYFGKVDLDANTSQTLLNGNAPNPSDVFQSESHIPAYNWIDLSGTWRFHEGMTLRAGVNNVFDKRPPVIEGSNLGITSPPFGNGNTYPQVYDALGRTIFIGLTADF